MKKKKILVLAALLGLTAFASTGSQYNYKKGLTGYVGINNNYT